MQFANKSTKFYRKRGKTPESDAVVTMRFEQMQDVDVWTWMEVIASEKVEEPENE